MQLAFTKYYTCRQGNDKNFFDMLKNILLAKTKVDFVVRGIMNRRKEYRNSTQMLCRVDFRMQTEADKVRGTQAHNRRHQ